MQDETVQHETVREQPATAVNDDDYEPIDDLGDALTLTQNGRAKVTENNRGHG
jgi:hypothetical protein